MTFLLFDFFFLRVLLSLHHFSGSYPPPNRSSCLGIPSGPACSAFLSGNIPEAFHISCYFPLLPPPPCWSEKARAASPRTPSPVDNLLSFCAERALPPSSYFFPKCSHLSVVRCLWTLQAPTERPSLEMETSWRVFACVRLWQNPFLTLSVPEC